MTDITDYVQNIQEKSILPSVKAYSFHTQYGNADDIGSIIYVEVDAGNSKITVDNKEIILVVDLSASTKSSLRNIKAGLLAFRDALLGYSAKQIMLFTPEERDNMLRDLISLKFITFNKVASLVWDNSSDSTFEEVVISLTSTSLTNLYAGLELALCLTNSSIFTWIILISDGEYNRSEYLTANSFQNYIDDVKPYNCKILTLAYGSEFNSAVLESIGTFCYTKDTDYISVILANIVEEILYSVAFNCYIDLDVEDVECIYSSDIIIASGVEISENKVLIGSQEVGPLVTGTTYIFAYLPGINKNIDNYRAVDITYTDISTAREISMSIGITPIAEAEDVVFRPDLKSKYFSQLKDNILYELYQDFNKSLDGDIVDHIAHIRHILKTWSDKYSEKSKLYIQHLLSEIFKAASVDQVKILLAQAIASKYDNIESMTACSALTSSIWYLQSLTINI